MDTTTTHIPTKRVEDDILLRGAGRYMADAPLPGQVYAAFVRSPHACADVKSVDAKAALARNFLRYARRPDHLYRAGGQRQHLQTDAPDDRLRGDAGYRRRAVTGGESRVGRVFGVTGNKIILSAFGRSWPGILISAISWIGSGAKKHIAGRAAFHRGPIIVL